MTHDLMGRIAAILREHWVPGLADSEYAKYAPMILPLVDSDADLDAIALRLESLEANILGRSTTDEHRLDVARKLQETTGQRRR